jgi:hypothetical protein
MSYDYAQHIFRSQTFQRVVDEAVEFFNRTHLHILPPPDRFMGAGVYGLYYLGDFEPYQPLAERNRKSCNEAIYIGKAVPRGWRTGRVMEGEDRDLSRRLREHSGSINLAANLNLGDFRCRFMILSGNENNLITTVEAALIRRYLPLWNAVVDGFGNHDPGSGRYNQSPSEWDILHPGRPWVRKLTGITPSLTNVQAKIRVAFNSSITPDRA